MEDKYERAIFDLDQTAIFSFGESKDFKNYAKRNERKLLFITCIEKSAICKKYSSLWGVSEPSLVGFSPFRPPIITPLSSDIEMLHSRLREPQTLKSEPVPEKNDDPVKIIVGKSFRKMVMDTKIDVFVLFYDPVDPNS